MNILRRVVSVCAFGVLSVALMGVAFTGGTAVVGGTAVAYESPGIPSGFVNDFAGVLDNETKLALESDLKEFEKATTTEISVVTVQNLGGDYIENYAEKLFKEWGIGKAKEDNGVLLLIAMDERELRIEVGYGLEGALTDLESGQIIEKVITPKFRDSDFVGGITDGVFALKEAVKGEYTAPEGYGDETISDSLAEIIGIAFFIFINIIFNLGRVFRGIGASRAIWPGAVFGGFFAALFSLMLGATWITFLIWFVVLGGIGLFIDWILSRAKCLENWRSKAKEKHDKGGGWWFIGGGRGGGGSGGGGFGGFGGGSSGGGGASGRW